MPPKTAKRNQNCRDTHTGLRTSLHRKLCTDCVDGFGAYTTLHYRTVTTLHIRTCDPPPHPSYCPPACYAPLPKPLLQALCHVVLPPPHTPRTIIHAAVLHDLLPSRASSPRLHYACRGAGAWEGGGREHGMSGREHGMRGREHSMGGRQSRRHASMQEERGQSQN